MDWLSRFGRGEATTDLADDLAERGLVVQTCRLQFLDFGGRSRYGGPARTVRCFEDNSRVRELVAEPGDGAVLVVDGGASLRTALVGDRLAGMALDNGWTGLVVNGAVRDRAALAEIPIGVRALGTNPRRSDKSGVGEVDVRVEFGDVAIAPGDLVLCDADGMLVIPHPTT